MKISVFNADDHPLLRKGVSDLLVQAEGIEWAGSASNGAEALEKIMSIQPDIAILDIEMPLMTGLDVARTLINDGIRTSFILFTLFKDETFLQNALSIGIMGYLLKESAENEILECIRSVYAGRHYVNPNMTQYLIRDNSNSNILNDLSKQEINIIKLIAMRKTSAEIADMLFISPKTVSNHRTNISKKLNLNGEQNGLLKWALEHKNLLT